MNQSVLVLYFLSFVQNYLSPLYATKHHYFLAQLVVGCYYYFAFFLRIFDEFTFVFYLTFRSTGNWFYFEICPKFEFLAPLTYDCRWTYYQHCSQISERSFQAWNQRYGAKCFSKSHLIRKNRPMLVQMLSKKPLQGFFLMKHHPIVNCGINNKRSRINFYFHECRVSFHLCIYFLVKTTK